FYGCTSSTSDYLNEAYHDHLTGTGDPVDVGSGAVVTGIDADMQHAASISGTVVDAVTHAPVSDVQVDVVVATNDGDNENSTQPVTDNAGHYTVGHLAPGSYDVFFFKSPYLQTPYPSE